MQTTGTSTNELQECVTKLADLTENNLKLLTQLDERLKAIEIDEWRFKIAVAGKLSRIEAMAQVLRISELIHTLGQYPKCELSLHQKLERQDQLIDKHSREIEGRMLDLMQGVAPSKRQRARQKKEARPAI